MNNCERCGSKLLSIVSPTGHFDGCWWCDVPEPANKRLVTDDAFTAKEYTTMNELRPTFAVLIGKLHELGRQVTPSAMQIRVCEEIAKMLQADFSKLTEAADEALYELIRDTETAKDARATIAELRCALRTAGKNV